MNIKSEFLNKSIPWFPNFSLALFLFSIVLAVFLSLCIIFFGQGLYLKILAIFIGTVILLIWTFDDSVTDKKDRDKTLIKGFMVFIFTLIFMEIPLYYNSKNTSKYNITVVITTGFKKGNKIPDNDDNSSNDKYEQIPFKLVKFYNADTNKELGYRKIYKGMEANLKLYTNIIGKETYIDYFPFFIYEKKFKYIRDNNDSR